MFDPPNGHSLMGRIGIRKSPPKRVPRPWPPRLTVAWSQTLNSRRRKTAKLMVFKLDNAAAKTWRRLKGEIPRQIPKQHLSYQNAGSPGRLIDLVTGSPAYLHDSSIGGEGTLGPPRCWRFRHDSDNIPVYRPETYYCEVAYRFGPRCDQRFLRCIYPSQPHCSRAKRPGKLLSSRSNQR